MCTARNPEIKPARTAPSLAPIQAGATSMAVILMVHPRGGATIASRPGATDGPWRRPRGSQACFCGVTALGLTSALAKGPPTPRRSWAAGTLASGIALASALAACAHAPAEANARAEYERNNDPAEPTNRAI